MHCPRSVLQTLERGGVVVTANTRAARDVRRLYGEHCIENKLQAWESPAIFDLSSWLTAQWHALLMHGMEQRLLLTLLQEEEVWAEVVSHLVASGSLIAPNEVARLARNAYDRLATYGGTSRLRLRDGEWSAHARDAEVQEPELFRRWAQDFERTCRRRGWLSSSLLPWEIAEAFRHQRLNAPPAIAWLGFDRVTPAKAALRNALSAAGCMQHDVEWGLKAQSRQLAAQTGAQELQACAEWVHATMQRTPGARIGVLVPDAAAMRAEVDRVFRRVLMPESGGLRQTPQKAIYEFSLGIPLGDVPLVRSAILLLRWLAMPLEREEASWLLATGFFADTEDAPALAKVDARMRREDLLPPEQGLEELLQRLERSGEDFSIARWVVRMRRAKSAIDKLLRSEHAWQHWIDAARGFLEEVGWPGKRPLDSVSFQMIDRWHELLDEVAQLDFAETRASFNHFLDVLTRQAKSSIFTAESADAPVVISGVLESAGRPFDAVWMLQATDSTWPVRTAAHPMLPGWLQRELQMPRGEPKEDTAFCGAIMKRLRSSTNELVASYAVEGANGAQRPSSLIRDLPLSYASFIATLPSEALTDWFDDDGSVAWPGGRSAGGQEVLKMQAACPFQAFATKRLGGEEARTSEHGLDAAQRGTLLHHVLQTLWQDPKMGGSDGLNAAVLSGELKSLIERHVDQALKKYRTEGKWERAYLQLERERLCALLDDWMLLELDRRPFAVENVEEKKGIDVHGLALDVRLDRVDRLLDEDKERRILIDYKTGDMNWKKWDTPRMDEPQLPLYAVAGNVDGLTNVFFAQLRPGKLRFIDALAGNQSSLFSSSGRKPTKEPEVDFTTRLQGWNEDLRTLSDDFQAGRADVDPKDRKKTCKYCAYAGLCRVAEIEAAADSDGDE